jgi:LAO/AO transport system kinase
MNDIIHKLQEGDKRTLAKCISMVENETAGYETLLPQLPFSRHVPITGITGPPGAGKSTLISAIVKEFIRQNKKIAIIAVDPSSPFNHGSIMGDRLRMSEHFLHPDVFIRSMATRGSLGGLAPKIFEVADVIRSAGFDHIIIETVGVGQSEVEIAALADTTVLVLVPEAGDEIQTMKSGVMEIADVYVVNKSDREGADIFYKNLLTLAHANMRQGWEPPVVKTVAARNEGIEELMLAMERHIRVPSGNNKKVRLLAEKAFMLIRDHRTRDISFIQLQEELSNLAGETNFNLYRYIQKYTGL